jgi:hypothetical protein
MATREGEYPFATIIALDGNVVSDAFSDAVRDASRKPDSEKRPDPTPSLQQRDRVSLWRKA